VVNALTTSSRAGMSQLVVAQLLHLEAENPKKEISMYINSPGGVVTSGLSIYDTMQYERDNFMSPEEAKDWGLIDEIMVNNNKSDD